jgi:hypothetical protein
MVGALPGTRCFDTLSFTTATTLVGQGRAYVIATTGKHPDQTTYARLLRSFRLLPPGTPPSATLLLP